MRANPGSKLAATVMSPCPAACWMAFVTTSLVSSETVWSRSGSRPPPARALRARRTELGSAGRVTLTVGWEMVRPDTLLDLPPQGARHATADWCIVPGAGLYRIDRGTGQRVCRLPRSPRDGSPAAGPVRPPWTHARASAGPLSDVQRGQVQGLPGAIRALGNGEPVSGEIGSSASAPGSVPVSCRRRRAAARGERRSRRRLRLTTLERGREDLRDRLAGQRERLEVVVVGQRDRQPLDPDVLEGLRLLADLVRVADHAGHLQALLGGAGPDRRLELRLGLLVRAPDHDDGHARLRYLGGVAPAV